MGANAATGIGIGLAAACGLLLPACAALPSAPDSAYRQAFEEAVTTARCSGPAVERMWAAHHRWFGVGSAITGHDRTDEAASLLRQGDAFLILGCPEVARASYAAVLERYPQPELAALRQSALIALDGVPAVPRTMPPGAPLPLAPGPVHQPLPILY